MKGMIISGGMIKAAILTVHLSTLARSVGVGAGEFSRPAGCGDSGMAVIMGCKQLAVAAGFMFVMHLLAQRHPVRFTTKTFFFAIRSDHDSAGAVEAHVHVVHYHVAAINVSDAADIDVEHGAVVEEGAAS